MKRFAAITIALCFVGIALAQQPKSTPTESVVYKLNPEASQAWVEVTKARKALAEQYQKADEQLQYQQAALLLGAGVPKSEWDRTVLVEAGIVTLNPKPKPTPK